MGVPNQTIYRDPWAKREAWRRHPVFSRRQQLKNFFPGFGIALVAFSGYVAWEKLSSSDSKAFEELRNQSLDQIQQKDNLVKWIKGENDKKWEAVIDSWLIGRVRPQRRKVYSCDPYRLDLLPHLTTGSSIRSVELAWGKFRKAVACRSFSMDYPDWSDLVSEQ